MTKFQSYIDLGHLTDDSAVEKCLKCLKCDSVDFEQMNLTIQFGLYEDRCWLSILCNDCYFPSFFSYGISDNSHDQFPVVLPSYVQAMTIAIEERKREKVLTPAMERVLFLLREFPYLYIGETGSIWDSSSGALATWQDAGFGKRGLMPSTLLALEARHLIFRHKCLVELSKMWFPTNRIWRLVEPDQEESPDPEPAEQARLDNLKDEQEAHLYELEHSPDNENEAC